MAKKNRLPTQKREKNLSRGILETLSIIRFEKATSVVPVKLPISVKILLKKIAGSQGVSHWVREVILEKLQSLVEEGD